MEIGMAEEEVPTQGELLPTRVGDRLRQAREQSGRSVAEIAAKTRIPQRHLEALETSHYEGLPGRTYITGFARAYARALDLNEIEIGAAMRKELAEQDYADRAPYEAYEPTDPQRLPTRTLAWVALAIALLLASAYGVWRFVSADPSEELVATEIAAEDDAATAAAAAPKTEAPGTEVATPPVDANAQVVLSGISEVWIGFDDATGKTENWRTLSAGETMVVPADYIEKFTLRTARPQALKITVGGRDVPQIGAPDAITSGISMKPAALMARTAPTAATGTASGATGAAIPQPAGR
jgi:cytoskeleton protein RodZ